MGDDELMTQMPPNWAEGNLRIRGKRENLISFLINELCCIKGSDNSDEPVETSPIYIKENCGGWTIILIKDDGSLNNFHFKNSDTQYIECAEQDLELSLSEGPNLNKDQVIFIDCFNAAWDIDEDFFKRCAIQYKIDIRIFVWELGLQWSKASTFYKNGKTEMEYKQYADWLWDCPLPHYGGW